MICLEQTLIYFDLQSLKYSIDALLSSLRRRQHHIPEREGTVVIGITKLLSFVIQQKWCFRSDWHWCWCLIQNTWLPFMKRITLVKLERFCTSCCTENRLVWNQIPIIFSWWVQQQDRPCLLLEVFAGVLIPQMATVFFMENILSWLFWMETAESEVI